jgi:hypothetical protein
VHSSHEIVRALLEDGDDMPIEDWADETDPSRPFDEGAAYVVDQSRRLYRRLLDNGALQLLTGISPDGIAQAVIRRTLEQQPTVAGDKAYKILRRHARYVF